MRIVARQSAPATTSTDCCHDRAGTVDLVGSTGRSPLELFSHAATRPARRRPFRSTAKAGISPFQARRAAYGSLPRGLARHGFRQPAAVFLCHGRPPQATPTTLPKNGGRRSWANASSAFPEEPTGPIGAVTRYSGTIPAGGHSDGLQKPPALNSRPLRDPATHRFVLPGAVRVEIGVQNGPGAGENRR